MKLTIRTVMQFQVRCPNAFIKNITDTFVQERGLKYMRTISVTDLVQIIHSVKDSHGI